MACFEGVLIHFLKLPFLIQISESLFKVNFKEVIGSIEEGIRDYHQCVCSK